MRPATVEREPTQVIVTRKEWIWAAVVTVLIVAASTVPYVVGALSDTSDLAFSGALLNRADYHSYLARMRQGYRGEWDFHLLFTPEEHQGIYSQPLYILLGHIARMLGTTMFQTFQSARVLLASIMLLLIYRFIAQFIPSVHTRQVTFLLAALSSGLGWLTEIVSPTPPGGISPMDFWLLDAYTYLAIMNSPHFCAATALLLTIFLVLLKRPEGPSLTEGLLAVAASFALGLVHPYTLLLADVLPVAYWFIQWLRTRRVEWRWLVTVVGMGIAQAPLVLYDLWVFGTQPVFVGWAAQNITLSPPPRIYLLGYGLLLVLGTIGVAGWARRGNRGLTFAALWIGLVAVLVYLPWNLQRRFLEGVQIPLAMAAGVGLAEVLLPLGQDEGVRWRWLARSAFVAMSTISNLFLTAGATMSVASQSPDLFSSTDVLAAADWLGENSAWSETVLAGPDTGSLIPARIGHRVLLGHEMETVDYDAKLEAVTSFFDAATSDEERLALVREWRVSYVFYGPNESALGNYYPSTTMWLMPVYRSGEVTIYKVAE